MSIRIGILGYGNLGRGVECAVKHNPDLELVAVFTRRDPASVKILTDTAKVYHVDEAEKMKKLENKKIPKDIDYDKVPNLASEARIKLKEVRPESFGQALRISGVNPSDVSILSVYMKRYFNE